jgi:uncharacterized membrane protein YfcA
MEPPVPETLPHLVFMAAVLMLGGLVKGVLGLGLPVISVGLLGLIMPPLQAAALLVVTNFATNVWQVAAGPSLGRLIARLWPMMLAICLGSVGGAGLLAYGRSGQGVGLLGGALAVYAGLGLLAVRPQVPRGAEIWLGPLVGAATGAITIVTGVFVVPAVPYLQALGLDREDLVQALGLSFLVSTLALAAVLAGAGLFDAGVAGSSVAALAPALLGMWIGSRLRSRLSQATFRLCFLWGLLALGLYLVLRTLAR